MVEDLRALPRDQALLGLDEALHTIGEREDAGYVTERMIEHRLRLLDFGQELGRLGPARFSPVPKIDSTVEGKTSDGIAVRAQLLVFGQTTEIVHEKEKLLLASFVLRLDVENANAKPITLHAPTITATGAGSFPVSRWYEAGTAGEPWSGALQAGTRKLVYVIGYASEPLQPGTQLDAAVRFESLVLPAKTHARRRWNEPS